MVNSERGTQQNDEPKTVGNNVNGETVLFLSIDKQAYFSLFKNKQGSNGSKLLFLRLDSVRNPEVTVLVSLHAYLQ